MNGKILGLDIGTKYIGCALADFKGIALEPLLPLKRKSGSLCLSALKKITKQNQVSMIVIGYPLSLENQVTSFSKSVKGVANKLRKHFPRMEIRLVHEGLSTWAGKKNFPSIRLEKSTQTPLNIDSFSAREILRTYFNEKEYAPK